MSEYHNEQQGDRIIEIPLEFGKKEKVEHITNEVITNSVGCKHYFIRMSDTEALCRNPSCQLGLFIEPTDRIVDGEIVGGG